MGDRMLIRLGAISAIVGAVLITFANILNRIQDTGIAQAQVKEATRSTGFFVGDSLVIVLSVVLILAGMVALQRTLKSESGASLAKLGLGAAALGTGIVVTNVTFGITNSALTWVSEISFATMLVSFGLAIIKGEDYPRGIGRLLTVGGVALLATGILEAYSGPIGDIAHVALPVIAILTSALTLWLGVLMYRTTQRATAHA